MRGLSMLRVLSAAVLTLGLGGVTAVTPGVGGSARAAGYETLMVPSAAMGRDIPVAFMGGGPHMVVLLDAFDANPDVSNWVTAGNAMNTLAGKGISVAAPASGAYSFYANWEQDGSKQWDTFLSSELPDWLAANKGLAPGGNAAVGAAQGGYGAFALATFHPDRYGYAGSMSGILDLSDTTIFGGVIAGFQNFAGTDVYGMFGAPQLGRVKQHDPYVHAALLAQNNTRIWVFSPNGAGASDPAAVIGIPDQAAGSARFFYQEYRNVGGHNGHFDFPGGGDNGWGSWSAELAAMSGDIAGAIR
ncbi:MAG: alpha/beta hydrolase family protein [Mycobacterium sp.]|uniref:alpha/beta hydrolase-fold protein n=1 Tax=Mycobacterium sp. TaxID=1785 RepID=UPI003CC6DAEC